MTRIFPYFSFTAIALFLSFDLYSIDLPDFTELAETHSPVSYTHLTLPTKDSV